MTTSHSLNSTTSISEEYLSWPKVLMQQHIQLKQKIKSIKSFTTNKSVCLFNLDAKLKQLTMGLKIHIQLEQDFLGSLFDNHLISSNQKNDLKEGYHTLYKACKVALKLSRTAILSRNCQPTNQENITKLITFLDDIEYRLNDEDKVYSLTYQGIANV